MSSTVINQHLPICKTMTTKSEWPAVDPMPSVEPSSDLFDGDILGDELIDIYNAAVVGGGDDEHMSGKFYGV